MASAFVDALRQLECESFSAGAAIVVERGLGYNVTDAPERAERVSASSARA
jgi:hypothetical protein